MFQSPIGVLYISIMVMEMQVLLRQMFPSPIGVLYISINMSAPTSIRKLPVSVPYWGSLYFNYGHGNASVVASNVSVPYWGSLYFNTRKRRRH